jgi:ATP-binding cassette subfamily C (CFTR/MRP) protein 1
MNINPFIVSMISFGTFILLNDKENGEELTAEKTFVTIALFNALRHPLYNLPNTLSNCIQVTITMNIRIYKINLFKNTTILNLS